MRIEVPDGWARVKVRDVMTLDRTMIQIEPEALYASVGVRSFGKGLFHYPPKTGANLGKLRFFNVQSGCLFISNIKAWEGAVAVASKADEGRVASNRFLPYFPNAGQVDVEFLQFYFSVGPGLSLIQMASPGSADRNRTLSISQFERLEFPLPPLPEQQKIVEILSSVDEAIQATEAVIEQTRRVKEGLLQELLTKGIGHTRFKQTKIGEIPEGWEVKRLGELCRGKPEYGANVPKSAFRDDWPRYIRITDVDSDGQLSSEVVSISPDDSANYMLTEGDLLLARSGATVGKSYHYRSEDGSCAFAGYMIRFRINTNRAESEFVFQTLRTGRFWQWIKSMAREGAQPNVNATEYAGYLVPLPPIEEQRRIIERLVAADQAVRDLVADADGKKKLKTGLLQDLLTGKVRVSV